LGPASMGLAVTVYQFRNRTDPFIFSSHFELECPGLQVVEVRKILERLKYQDIQQIDNRLTATRLQFISNEHFPEANTFAPFQVLIDFSKDTPVARFAHLSRRGFDGTQVSYRGAMEFKKEIAERK